MLADVRPRAAVPGHPISVRTALTWSFIVVGQAALFAGLRSVTGLPLASELAAALVVLAVVAGVRVAAGRTRTGGMPSRWRVVAVLLAVLAVAGAAELCLAVSHYGLGRTSLAVDLLSGNVAGPLLAAAVRIWPTAAPAVPFAA